MKQIVTLIFIAFSLLSNAQETEEVAVKTAIDNFFIGFHQKDRTKMENAVTKEVVMQTVATDKEGNVIVRTEVYDDFVKSILSIPLDAHFEEKLFGYNIQIDGNMAHVWTPYGFWFNNQFSHCGVNSIQLVKLDGQWKIVYLIDTRRKENCVQD